MRQRLPRNYYGPDADRFHRLAHEHGRRSSDPERSAVLQWLRVRPDRQHSDGYASAFGCVYGDDTELFTELCFVCPSQWPHG
jgi:hypothetical protein